MKQQDPKTRILLAAENLFALKGYSAVGVRELAAEADVNSAMINYYFGSKQGVLVTLIDQFFEQLQTIADQIFDPNAQLQENFSRFIDAEIQFVFSHPKLVRCVMIEFPHEMPDIGQYKAQKVQGLINRVKASTQEVQMVLGKDSQILAVVGPALISMIISHVMFKPVISQLGVAELDDDFYKKFPQVIKDILFGGLPLVLQNVIDDTYKKSIKQE